MTREFELQLFLEYEMTWGELFRVNLLHDKTSNFFGVHIRIKIRNDCYLY